MIGTRSASFILALMVAAPAATQEADNVVALRVSDTDRYDPQRSTALAAAEVLYMVGETLVTLDHDLKTVRPGLAERWEVSPDGLTYTFHLRRDVSFCDAKPFTAKAVVGTMDRWLDPDFPGVSKWKAGKVESVKALDDYTVEYRLKQPYSELLYQMTQFNFIIIDPDQATALKDDFGVAAFNGTGPFCFQSWTPRTETVLTRHEAYRWGPAFMTNSGPAKVGRIVWKIVPEEATLAAALQTGEGDVSFAVPPWALAQLQSAPSMQLLRPQAGFRTHYIGMKITRPDLTDRRVREALSLAVDQAAIADAIFFGEAEAAHAYYSKQARDFNPQMNLDAFGYDPERAKSLLDEAGWIAQADGTRMKDGNPLSLVFYGFTSESERQMAEAVQGDLRKIGVELKVELYDPTIVWGKLKTQDFDLYQMSYPYLSAGEAMNLYFLSSNMPTPNRMNWADPKTDQLIDAGNRAITPDARYAAFAEAGAIIHDAVLWKPLVNENLVVVAGPRLKPFKPHGVSGAPLYNGLDLELAK
ncbi:peptide ABC transporter substrate-binding protein [Sinorhizobium sp. A49]|uniref:ABC transporter substrate-binding protein n=1 Tax=Sinorhizobium sp. A49 TaxID=1945861 RepID=UPI0009869084|nr:ABC transporter substrate-binding protein [Sinorhizobium sp. A49]OOG65282.1 peptide ABC transporter substrate-binding protein [Sinorhizobium sp. A49]